MLAVLLDGDSWKSRRTVADRDGLPIEVLKNLMHWPAVERVWLPEWLHAREAVLDRLELAIADVQAADANGAQLARIDSMVEQALEDDADIESPASSTSTPASTAYDEDDAAAAESPSESLSSTDAPGLFLKLGTTSPTSPSTTADLIDPYTPWTSCRVGSIAVLDALPAKTPAERSRPSSARSWQPRDRSTWCVSRSSWQSPST